jgi:hypothetical protein
MEGSITDSYFNQDKNPGLDQISPSSPGEVNGGGGLTTEQLADNGIHDAVLSGGDVAGAIADYNTAHTPPPDTGTPGNTGTGNTGTDTPGTPPVVEAPDPEDTPDTPPVTEAPGPEDTPDIPPVVEAPDPEDTPDIPPVVEAPDPEDTHTPPVADLPAEPTPPVADRAETEALRALAAQSAQSGRQVLDEVVSRALDEQAAGFERARVPLDELLARLTQAPAGGPAATPAERNYDSTVDEISVEGRCYTTRGDEQACR